MNECFCSFPLTIHHSTYTHNLCFSFFALRDNIFYFNDFLIGQLILQPHHFSSPSILSLLITYKFFTESMNGVKMTILFHFCFSFLFCGLFCQLCIFSFLSLLRSIRRQIHKKKAISVSFQANRHQFDCFYC